MTALAKEERKKENTALYHYTECGLDNVWIHGVRQYTDNVGNMTYAISNLPYLHREIARALVMLTHGLSGKELRFLRTELAMSQATIGKIVHKDGQTVGRWERDEFPIDPNADTIIRLLTIEHFKLDLNEKETIQALSDWVSKSGKQEKINITPSDDKGYYCLSAMAA